MWNPKDLVLGSRAPASGLLMWSLRDPVPGFRDCRPLGLDFLVWDLKGMVLDSRALVLDLLGLSALVHMPIYGLGGLTLDLLALDLGVPALGVPV